MTETRTITYGETTFTRTAEGGASGYAWRSPRWVCDTCQVTGYGEWLVPSSWAVPHARGHKPCPWCERPLTLCMDGSARVHTRCPARPEPVEDDWMTVKELLTETRALVAEGVQP